MDVPKKHSPVVVGVFFLASAACLAFLFTFFTAPQGANPILASLGFFGAKEPQVDPCFATNEEGRYPAGLNCVLKRAAMEDSTVIFTMVNDAWAQPNSLLDIFFQSLRAGYQTEQFMKHVVLVAMDEKAYNRCLEVHPHCAIFKVLDGVDFTKEKPFMTKDYLELTWSKLLLMRSILELGYNFVFTDIDVIWLRNPMVHLRNTTADIVIACDRFRGNHSSIDNNANTGFNYVRSSNRTIEFYRYWYRSRGRFPGHHEQHVFGQIKGDDYARRLGMKFWFLDTDRFSGFCAHGKDPSKVCTMHANCCRGLHNKLRYLRVALEDYGNFTAALAEGRDTSNIKWRIPNWC